MQRNYKDSRFRKSYSFHTKNRYSISHLNTLEENNCIIISFSKGAFSYTKSIIIKCHIFFGTKTPEIYVHPIKQIYSFALHSNCDICKFWLNHFTIIDNKFPKEKLAKVLFSGENPVLLIFSPYLKRVITYSDLVNEDSVNKCIIKKDMPNFGNIFISGRFDHSYINKNDYLLDLFKILTKSEWNNLNDTDTLNARCSIFMNFVNENDLDNVKGMFQDEIYEKINKICSCIKHRNYNLFPDKFKSNERGFFNSNNFNMSRIPNCNEKAVNINSINSNYGKENIVINLSDDDDDNDSEFIGNEIQLISENIQINDLKNKILKSDEKKKEVNKEKKKKKEKAKIVKSSDEMLKKKRKSVNKLSISEY